MVSTILQKISKYCQQSFCDVLINSIIEIFITKQMFIQKESEVKEF